MNIGEANDVQHLLRYLFDEEQQVTCAVARAAMTSARNLADRSHKAIGAGWRGDDLAGLGEFGGCDGCDECERPITDVPVGELL